MVLQESPRSESGFSLVEVLVASVILLVGVMGTVGVLSAASRASALNRQRDAATNLARDVVEASRSVPYDQLTDTGLAGELQQVPGLEDAPGGGYDVARGGVDLQIAVDVCIVDDPSDGGGPRAAATTSFCANSAPAGTQDRNPEDYKKVTTTISWRQDGKRGLTVVQTGIVNNPGSASGPAVRSITPRLLAPYVVTTAATTAVVVDFTTSSKPAAINWLLDGTVMQPAPTAKDASGVNWLFTWQLGDTETGVRDGSYILAAEAFNQYGVSGPGRQETVILNRRIPFAPAEAFGGRMNNGRVELEWTENAERDIVGYEVVREDGTVVCPLATQQLRVTCADPAAPSAAQVRYDVYAYDTNEVGVPRRGDVRAHAVIDDRRPAPANLRATRAADGSVTLSWDQSPAPAGDRVGHYLVYRDGSRLDDRPTGSGSTVTWRDADTGGVEHTYRVTAVHKHRGESAPTGPVTL